MRRKHDLPVGDEWCYLCMDRSLRIFFHAFIPMLKPCAQLFGNIHCYRNRRQRMQQHSYGKHYGGSCANCCLCTITFHGMCECNIRDTYTGNTGRWNIQRDSGFRKHLQCCSCRHRNFPDRLYLFERDLLRYSHVKHRCGPLHRNRAAGQ